MQKHPFVLHGLRDPAEFLAKPEEGSYVNVTEADVAAAVTNSNSFRTRLKRGVLNFGHKMMGGMLGSSKNGRSRSQSVVQTVDKRMSGDTFLGLSSSNSQASPAPGLSRRPSGSIPTPRIASGGSDQSSLSQSPRPVQARRMSLFGQTLANPRPTGRSISPLPLAERREGSLAASWNRPYLAPDDDALGRSVSDRSTASSNGPQRRAPPARRQSTHLAPPTIFGERLEGRGLNGSASIEALAPTTLEQMIQNSIVDANGERVMRNILRRQDSNEDRTGRQRALSNASSANSSGLGTRIGRIFGRGHAHRGTSIASSVMSTSHLSTDELRGHYMPSSDMSEVESLPEHHTPDMYEPSKLPEPSLGNAAVRSQPSRETFSSIGATSSVMMGSSVPHSNGFRRSQLPPLEISTFDAREAIGISPEPATAVEQDPSLGTKNTTSGSPLPEPRPTMIADESASFFSPTGEPAPHLTEVADWDGQLSDDDDEDYGQELTQKHAFDRQLRGIGDLHTGVWKLDSNGWKGSSLGLGTDHELTPVSSTKQGLCLELSHPTPRYQSETVTPIASLRNSMDQRGQQSPRTADDPPKTPDLGQPHDASSPASPSYPTYPESRRTSFSQPRGSPLRTRSPFAHLNPGATGRRTSVDRLGTSPMRASGLADHFERDGRGGTVSEDSNEDDEDEGLAFDLSKRGRRASKPLTPADSKLRLPQV